MALLEIKNLKVEFKTEQGKFFAVDDLSLSLEEGETLAIVGESGSGKSVTATSILRLLDPNGRIAQGQILFSEKGETVDLTTLPQEKMYSIRGNRISMIFQEPMTALNPVFTVERQLCEPLFIHRKMKKKAAKEEAVKLLASVNIPSPERVVKEYPHRLSGGMRQRVMIAMALACDPKLLIADEPTTALDVTVQAQILKLIRDLQKKTNAAVLFITHDLGVVNEIADKVTVTYCGQTVESAEKNKIFSPRGKYSHPYTEGLLSSAPNGKRGKLETIPGSVPTPFSKPKGCKFSPRCKYCAQKCVEEEPPLFEVKPNHFIRCFYPEKEERRSEEHERLIVRPRA